MSSNFSAGGPSEMTRRDFIRLAAAGATTLGVGPGRILAAPRSSPPDSATSRSPSTKKPKRGGTLHVGLSNGSSTDTMNPFGQPDSVVGAYSLQLFDSLMTYDSEAQLQFALASEITPNSNGTVWTIRLKPGVTFHNGKDVTADDVIYSLAQVVNPKSPGEGAPLLSTLIVHGMKKLDKTTVQVPFSSPFSIFPELLLVVFGFPIVPVGFDPRHPIGTGPFRYKSFSPGLEAVFTRNDNYWQDGLPYVDQVIVNDVADETTQVNGLISGQFDLIDYLSSASIATITAGGAQALISDGGNWNPFTMRCDKAPFSDVRLRQAFRLIVDRQQMLDLVFAGHGLIGNDLYGMFDPLYDHALPQRTQDIPQAKYLLKKAGLEGLSVNLVTSPVGPGITQSAQVFAQQANAAGVKVNIQTVPQTVFYGPNYLKWEFAQDDWNYYPYLLQVAAADFETSPYDETHFSNQRYFTLYREALATTNLKLRTELAHEMQVIYYMDSGYIIPFYSPCIDGYSKRVSGLVKSKTGVPLNMFDLKSIWVT